jgi:hypothetical protein
MKKIAILFTGESRINGLSNNEIITETILDSYKKYFFTDSFIENYDYDIFIITDDINIEKILEFFGKERVKNIYFMNIQNFLYSINQNIYSYDVVLNKCKKIYSNRHKFHENGIQQFYKCYIGFSLLSNYNEYDYIIRSRLDIEILEDVQTQIERLEQNESIQIIAAWDAFAIGRPNIMKEYLNMVLNYGSYDFIKSNHDFKRNIICIEKYNNRKINQHDWLFSPEIQLFECLFDYCDKNNYIIDDTILGKNCMVSIIRYDRENKVFTKQIFENS